MLFVSSSNRFSFLHFTKYLCFINKFFLTPIHVIYSTYSQNFPKSFCPNSLSSSCHLHEGSLGQLCGHQFPSLLSWVGNHYFEGPYGEGDGTPLQYSCLENPMDGGAWLAAVHGVAKSWTWLSEFTFMNWRRKWQPTLVFLPGESQGWGSLVGCRLWGHTELDTTEVT